MGGVIAFPLRTPIMLPHPVPSRQPKNAQTPVFIGFCLWSPTVKLVKGKSAPQGKKSPRRNCGGESMPERYAHTRQRPRAWMPLEAPTSPLPYHPRPFPLPAMERARTRRHGPESAIQQKALPGWGRAWGSGRVGGRGASVARPLPGFPSVRSGPIPRTPARYSEGLRRRPAGSTSETSWGHAPLWW